LADTIELQLTARPDLALDDLPQLLPSAPKAMLPVAYRLARRSQVRALHHLGALE
jgi:hypothetical protein